MKHNLSDNEIIKALECCINCDCKNCPCKVDESHCDEIPTEEILDLINRLKAENERLENSGIRANSVDDWLKHCNELRAEAREEFVTKAEEKASNLKDCTGTEVVFTVDDLYNLLKEMG